MEINKENFEEMLDYLTGGTIIRMIEDLENSLATDWVSDETKPTENLAKILKHLKDYFTEYHAL